MCVYVSSHSVGSEDYARNPPRRPNSGYGIEELFIIEPLSFLFHVCTKHNCDCYIFLFLTTGDDVDFGVEQANKQGNTRIP